MTNVDKDSTNELPELPAMAAGMPRVYVNDDRQGDGFVRAEDYQAPVEAPRRAPGLPLWLRDWQAFTTVARAEWRPLVGWVAYTMTVGVLVMYVQLVRSAPAGLMRLARWLFDWVNDTTRHQRAQELIRSSGVGDANVEEERHQAKTNSHRTIVAVALLAVVAGWVMAPPVPGAYQLAAIAVAASIVGAFGRTADSPALVQWLQVQTNVAPTPTVDLVIGAMHGVGVGGRKGQGAVEIYQPPTRTATGWQTIVDLPRSPTVEVGDVVPKRAAVAAHFRRPVECVWLRQAQGEGSHAGRLDITITRVPLRDMPMPPHPHAAGQPWDYFTDPTPVGIDEQGQRVGRQTAYESLVIGGVMGSGKTVTMVNDTLTHAADPSVELHIQDYKGGIDWLDFSLVAHYLRSGSDPADHDANLADLLDIERRMDARFETLKRLRLETGQRSPKTTRALADTPGLDLHPIRIVFDETQEQYETPPTKDIGLEYKRVVARIKKRGRAVGITCCEGTQEVKDKTLPTRRLSNIKHCMMVNSHTEVELILGTGTYAAGHHANALTADDRGIGYYGSGKDISIVRSFYVDPDNGDLEAACRAIHDRRLAAGRLTGMAAGDIEPDDRTDGIFHHVVTVWPGAAAKVAYEDLVPLLADRWPGLYGHWAGMGTNDATRALSHAIGPDVPSVTVAKGDRRPKGVTLRSMQDMAAAMAAKS